MLNFNTKQQEQITNYVIDTDNGLYSNLNKLVGGYNTGELVVIAARPGVGKSTIAFNFACCACYIDTTLFFSLEMSHAELQQRASKFLAPDAKTSNLWIETKTSIGLSDIEQEIVKYKPKFVFIDYLNIMQKDNIKIRTTRLKAMAKTYNCVIFVLAQLNRKAYKSTPDLTMLKDTGNIEQDATQVYFLTKDKLIVGKNRKGKIGEIPIIYDYSHYLIYEDKQKIHNWKKCLKLYEKWNAVDWVNKKLIEHKIKKIDEAFYYNYIYNDVELPTGFVMLVGGR